MKTRLRSTIILPAAMARGIVLILVLRPVSASAGGLLAVTSATIVDNSTDVGPYANLVMVDGHPAISYFDRFNLRLKFARAGDVYGTAWGAPVVVDSTTYSGLYASLAVVNGNPAIAYYNSSSKSLHYVRAKDADGLNWAAPVTVDSNGTVGLYASLAVVNGNPAIAYQDETDANNAILKFVRASDANGSTWGAPVVADNSNNPGWGLSMMDVNGYPAIAYFNVGGTASLRFVSASNANGTAWNSSIAVDSPMVGTSPSLAIVDGKPAIAYGDTNSSANGHLNYVRAKDANGASWGTPFSVVISGNAGYFPWLAVMDGFPAVVYTDNTTHSLYYVQSSDIDGAKWLAPFTVDSGQFDAYSSLADVNGKPGIAYEDYSGTGTLRFIVPNVPNLFRILLPVVYR